MAKDRATKPVPEPISLFECQCGKNFMMKCNNFGRTACHTIFAPSHRSIVCRRMTYMIRLPYRTLEKKVAFRPKYSQSRRPVVHMPPPMPTFHCVSKVNSWLEGLCDTQDNEESAGLHSFETR